METLRPKDWAYPKDVESIKKSPEDYITRLLKAIDTLYRSVKEAFKRSNAMMSILIDLDTQKFTPPRVNQADEPTLDLGEATFWRDTDDGKVYLVYNDPDSGQVKIELT